jgi:Tfp pilus assembly protein PilV
MGIGLRFPAARRDINPGLGLVGQARKGSGLGSFTLVEVVIAIAVVAFVLVSLLGLMTYTSQLVQQADTYSRLSNVSSQVLAQLDSQPYSLSFAKANTNATTYFTYEGLPTNSAAGYYQCVMSKANPAGWTLSSVLQVQLTITWPKPEFTNTNVIISSTLQYDY